MDVRVRRRSRSMCGRTHGLHHAVGPCLVRRLECGMREGCVQSWTRSKLWLVRDGWLHPGDTCVKSPADDTSLVCLWVSQT